MSVIISVVDDGVGDVGLAVAIATGALTWELSTFSKASVGERWVPAFAFVSSSESDG